MLITTDSYTDTHTKSIKQKASLSLFLRYFLIQQSQLIIVTVILEDCENRTTSGLTLNR